MTEAFSQRWEELRNLPGQPEISIFPDRAPRIAHQAVVDPDLGFQCPRCRYNLTGTVGICCPECGTHLEYEPVAVFTAADMSLVWAAAMLMDRQEISNLIVAGGVDLCFGIVGRFSAYNKLLVPFKFYHEAVAILDAEMGKRVWGPGEHQPERQRGPDWECAKCGEANPESFETCWNCQGSGPNKRSGRSPSGGEEAAEQ